MPHILEVQDLHKSYGKVKALRGISFSAEESKLFALLGPNGAGKSTTIDICCTLLKSDAGAVKVDGFRLGESDAEIRARIGVVFQQSVLDSLLTVKENLYIRGSFYGLRGKELRERAEKAARQAQATEFWTRPCGKLSGGQRRRADIARALLTTPRLLFLDEPTTGLDPQTRRAIWDTVRALQKEEGMSVLLTTHYMEEAAQADSIVVVDHGLVSASGTPEELREQYTSDVLLLEYLPEQPRALTELLRARGYEPKRKGGILEIPLKDTMESVELLPLCRDYIRGAELKRGSMDDAFLAITGEEVRE
ncbi:MAG: ATP-binding cassette domain-containing protein [Oscillospiraceae bacterium]|nr:ATP-binding cassette domain-containing protein [Oscillospiraceae bacterium]